VPLPLFWWQYANHQHPERNTGSNPRIVLLSQTPDALEFRCTSANASGSAVSEYRLRLTYSYERASYVYHIECTLRIPQTKSWTVTPNPAHGEVEFCNLWPARCFSTNPAIPKRYQSCMVERQGQLIRIPHHHLESPDKHQIELQRGDRFAWLLEATNPVLEMRSRAPIHAGVCAYMWDAHFGYRVTDGATETILRGPREFMAEFDLYAIDGRLGAQIIARADAAGQNAGALPELCDVPVYLHGLKTFGQVFGEHQDALQNLWPWAFDAANSDRKQAKGRIDRGRSVDGAIALCIDNAGAVASQWVFSALGPAFGGAAFTDGARYRLSAQVATEGLEGAAEIGIRLHQPGHGEVFDLADYAHYRSAGCLCATREWTTLEIITPIITPAPDRIHFILSQQGRGTTWFKRIVFEELT